MNHHFMHAVWTTILGLSGIFGVQLATVATPAINPEIEPLIIQIIVAMVTVIGIWIRSRNKGK